MDVPPHPTPSLPVLGRLIPSGGPSVLWVTITHIHVTLAPSLPWPGPGAAGDAFVGRGGQRLPGLGAPAVSPPPGWTMGRFVREGTGSGKQSVSLISRFKGMRGVGKRGEAPLPARERGSGMRWERSGRGDVREAGAGLSVLSSASVPGQQPHLATRCCAEGLTGSSDAPGRGQRRAGRGREGPARSCSLGATPEVLLGLLERELPGFGERQRLEMEKLL